MSGFSVSDVTVLAGILRAGSTSSELSHVGSFGGLTGSGEYSDPRIEIGDASNSPD